MQNVLNLLQLNRDDQVGPELWYIYTKLVFDALSNEKDPVKSFRNAGELVSSVSPLELADEMNLSQDMLKTYFTKLIDMKWVIIRQGFWRVGSVKKGQLILLAAPKLKMPSIPKPKKGLTTREKLDGLRSAMKKRRATESVTKLSEAARVQALAHIRKRKNAKSPGVRILAHAEQEYLKAFKSSYPMSVNLKDGKKSFPKEIGYINRYLGYCNNDEDEAKKLLTWVFENWADVSKSLNLIGAFNIGIMASNKLFPKIRDMYAHAGMADIVGEISVGDRYNKHAADESPDVGF